MMDAVKASEMSSISSIKVKSKFHPKTGNKGRGGGGEYKYSSTSLATALDGVAKPQLSDKVQINVLTVA